MSQPAAPGDHFSTVARAYADFRPRYPAPLFEYVRTLTPSHRRAWDCGAGSGQASDDLAAIFAEVIATDVSWAQVSQAATGQRVRWAVCKAEASAIADACVDLVVVAQALHWFDHDAFYAEVRRVAAPGAAIVAWTYGSPVMDGALGRALTEFMYGADHLGPYWTPERQYVKDEYRTIPFPFTRLSAPRLVLGESWTPVQLLGYARSWSATSRYVKQHGADPVPAFEAALPSLWPNAEPRKITWPLVVLVGRT